MIEYQLTEPCCGVTPRFLLPDQAMADYFASCPGGLPEASLIDWAWSQVGEPGELFIDVGANVGTWTLPFLGAGMNVVAFEPNLAIWELLRRAVGGPPTIVIHSALGDQYGTAILRSVGNDGVMGSIVRRIVGPNEVVPITRLDDYCLAPSVIKIDVEGAEVDVLRGAVQTITDNQPTIFFECWEQERGQRKEELFATIAELGYQAVRAPYPEVWMATPA